jgi:D-lactate dehydrogenase (cytochrome)
LIAPGMVKIGTDFSVPMKHLKDLLDLYEKYLPKGNSYVFGHIGNAHLHANILARSTDEMSVYRSLVQMLGTRVCELDGSVSGEHGIGKLKQKALEMMIGREGVEEIQAIKKILDPHLILNRGNIVSLAHLE